MAELEPDPARTIDALVERARAAMAGASAAPPEPVLGEAADGKVRAEVTGERLTSLFVDPTLLRQPLPDTTAQIVEAVNAALAARPGPPDVSPVLGELRAVQEQSVADMARIAQAFTAALERAKPR